MNKALIITYNMTLIIYKGHIDAKLSVSVPEFLIYRYSQKMANETISEFPFLTKFRKNELSLILSHDCNNI